MPPNRLTLQHGNYLVALGASLWALDGIFRSHLVGTYSALLIVFVTQLICALIVIPVCWAQRKKIFLLDPRDWAGFFFLAVASNILAMAAFTYAFSQTSNYSAPILIQKLQPLISIFSATLFLKEPLPKKYFIHSAIAITGSFLVGFGGSGLSIDPQDMVAVFFSVIAAVLWGLGTVVGRFVSTRHSFLLVTAMRYGLAVLVMLLFTPVWWSEISVEYQSLVRDLPLFLGMALVPGLLALAIYYRGLQVTRASVACWLELAYPVTAVALNWIFLGSNLTSLQICGGILLLVSVPIMNYQSVHD